MIPSSKSRLPIYVGGWLATAVATFSLGRLTADSLEESHRSTKAPASKTASSSGSANIAGTASTSSGDAGSNADDVLARVFGSHAVSLDEILGGRSLEDHVKHLLKQDDDATRMLGFLRLLEGLNNPDDIKKTLELIGSGNGGRFRMTEQAMLLQKWAQSDPKAAAEFASSRRDFSRFTGMNAVLKTWLKGNPEEAIAWAQQNGTGGNQGGFGGRGPGGGGPGGGGGNDNWAIASIVPSLAEKDLDRALKLASDQPVSQARGRMIDSLIDQMVAQRGDDSARNSVASMEDNAFRAGMAERMAGKMAETDPQKAGDWAKTLPAGDTRERALSQVISDWAQKDVVAAGQYLQGLPASPDLDSAREQYARTVARQDPQSAMTWAQTITDQKQQADTVQRVLRDWTRTDATAAQTWATANNVAIPQGGPGGGRRNRGGGGGGAPAGN